jgi:hypothetical protein
MSEPLIFDVQVLTANISTLFTLQHQMLQTCGICQKDSRTDCNSCLLGLWQVVGRRGCDRHLLDICAYLEQQFAYKGHLHMN